MADLTDEQLAKLLKDFGEDVGPLNNLTRPLWEKRLTKLKNSRDQIFASPRNYISNSDTEEKPRSNRILNRSSSADCVKLTSLNSSEEISSSFELGSPLRGEPGSSPYPFRVKPKISNVKKKKNLLVLEVESPNSHDDFQMNAKNVISSELKSYLSDSQLRKMLKDHEKDVDLMSNFTRSVWKKKSLHINTSPDERLVTPMKKISLKERKQTPFWRQECSKNVSDKPLNCDEENFAAEDSTQEKRMLQNITNILHLLIRGIAFVLIAALLILLMIRSWHSQIDEEKYVI
ncbi:LEM domain-containing protein [Nephila pilipes]|uniref:LEM domain-containing protein n=1 Tax=Nephila pilipes TaxID=299642 RepID=A0A8X6UMU0_NEPPI|nr:LEM domain-containing protein [Nephila pilipes]